MADDEFDCWMVFRAGTTHVRYEDLPDKIAVARWGDASKRHALGCDLNYGVERLEQERKLRSAVQAEALVVSDAHELKRHPFPLGDALIRSVVLLPELRRYLASAERMRVRVQQRFFDSPRPLRIDPALLATDRSEVIEYVTTFGRWQGGEGHQKAGSYADALRQQLQRQAEGFFTVDEAAQLLADSRPGSGASAMVENFQQARVSGRRLVRHANSRLPVEDIKHLHGFDLLVLVSDIDQWLDEQRVGYRFPEPTPAPERAIAGRRLWTLAEAVVAVTDLPNFGVTAPALMKRAAKAAAARELGLRNPDDGALMWNDDAFDYRAEWLFAEDFNQWLGRAGYSEPYWLQEGIRTVVKGESVPVVAVLALALVAELPDPQRRLAALEASGGSIQQWNGKWSITGIDRLTDDEKAAKRKRSDQKTIRKDLHKAAEARKREGPGPAPSSPFPT